MRVRNSQDFEKLLIAAGKKVKEKEFWLEKLSGDLPKGSFPFTHSERMSNEGIDSVNFRFDGHLYSGLMKMSAGSDVRLHMILTAILTLLIARYSGNDDILVGTPLLSSGKESAGLINTVLVLRNQLTEEMSFKELLLQVRQTMIQAGENQNYPIEVLIRQLGLPDWKEDDGCPLFDAAISLENIQDKQHFSHIKPKTLFSFFRTEGFIDGKIEYDARFYDRTAIERIFGHFRLLTESVLGNPDVRLSAIGIITDEERKRILDEFNDAKTEYPRNKTIHELFDAQVVRAGDRIAIIGVTFSVGADPRVCPQFQLSYRELNRQSDQLANRLRDKGVGLDTIVGVQIERSIEMVVAILGILKIGAAYLPLNPRQPQARTDYMMKDSGAALLISTGNKEEVEKALFIDHLILSSSYPLNFSPPPSPSVSSVCSVRNTTTLAYIIYTSGSTGNPKGVPVSHSNFSPLIHWGYTHLGINETDRVIQNLSYYFDWSVWEIFIALTTGASLHMISEEILLNPEAEVNFILKHIITVLHITPTQYGYLLNVGKKLETLKYLLIGAEKLTVNLARRSIESVNADCRIFNMYGPTEATIIAAVSELKRSALDVYSQLTSIPIGTPVGNTALLIVDRYMNLLPVGVNGELYIAGDGVVKGYLNNPELTFERFCLRLGEVGFERFYKTGDLARWLSDGTIEFLGRIDQQVKVRGYRIELEEIENRLLKYEGIKDAILICKTDEYGENFLCAYMVGEYKIQTLTLREYLSSHLPDYMIPSHFIQMDQIPLTPNGKVDRKALPELNGKPEETYVAPEDPIEKKQAQIWSELLGIEIDQIGVHDDFFQLGGHSLKAAVLASKIHENFNVKMSLPEVFEIPTIRGLSEYIKKAVEEKYVSFIPAEKKEYYVLSSQQKRLYILHQTDVHGASYNIPFVSVLEGSIDKGRLENIFRELIRRHESLRTSFHMVDDEPMQMVHDEVEFNIEYFLTEHTGDTEGEGKKLRSEAVEKLSDRFIKSFDLGKAPLIRVGLIKETDRRHILILDMHHIISDGTSMNIIVNDFMAIVKGETLPELRIQYKDFSEWQNREGRESQRAQEAFWFNEFDGEIPALELPIDDGRPAVQSFEGKQIGFELNEEETDKLNALALENGATLYMVLLGAYNILLSKLSGQEDIIVGTPVAGRRHADLEHLIGMFV
ncbi:MAG: amino acid adenylation domain-containing protein, partial [Candidatus Omnitrophota bacterium]